MTETITENEAFARKISVLYETPPLWSDEDFNNIKNIKDCKDKLEKMSNLNYYIRSDDLTTIINNADKNIYLRLVIDPPYKYRKNELLSTIKDNEDNMSVSDSPGRAKTTSKSSENIRPKKSRRSVKNNDKRTIKIRSKSYFVNFVKDEEKHSVFLCDVKDDMLYCNFINEDEIKGDKFSKLLTYESVDVKIGDKNIMINSSNIKNLNFPIYFIIHNYELNIDDFVCIIESILKSI